MSSLPRFNSDEADSKPDSERKLTQVFLEPVKQFNDDLSKLLSEAKSVESAYASRLKIAISELRDSLQQEIRESLSKESDIRLREAIELVREQFNERLATARKELENENTRLTSQIEEMKRRDDKKELHAEMERSISALTMVERDIGAMLEDPAIELSKVIRQNAIQAELRAYIRGLSFRMDTKSERFIPTGD